MDVNKLLENLKNKKYDPIYLLHGEESYFIDVISDYIEEHVLEPAHRGFDQTVLYGKDTDFTTIVNAARRFPMIADHQVIIVKEAQSLPWKSDDDVLIKYLSNPMPQTLLVFASKHGKFDKRRKVYKMAEKVGVVVESAKIYPDKVAAWVMNYVRGKGRGIHPQAAALIGEYLGTDLGKVVNEVEKLMLNVSTDQEINLQDVERYIGISKDFNVFELNTALAQKDALKAFRIVDYFAANPRNNPIQLTIGAMGTYFTKVLKYHYLPDKSPQIVAKELGVHPFFTREYDVAARNYGRRKMFDVLHYLSDYDLKSKGVSVGTVDNGELLKELVFKILN